MPDNTIKARIVGWFVGWEKRMARGVNKLTAMAVAKQKKPGCFADGGNLYLQVGPTGGKAWLFRFMLHGRAREMGLGPVDAVSLSEARSRAADARKLLHQGIDPLEERMAKEARAKADRLLGMSFKQCAEAYISSHKAGWRNEKHANQWESTLAAYAFATNLRRLRHEKGLSQDVLAYDAGMSRSYLAQLETGKYYASLKIIGRLADVLGVDPAEFLKGPQKR